ncbi:MAG: universal stress protein UspA [Rhodopirellula sp.]|nr:universal stress protein UspA [Rhodopirellula sp.]|tara:strand:- start:26 stop:454 length:429 start_codon:yes stop_codon:yes gene_type:complete
MPGMTSENTVVPIDFSDLSYAALDRALEISSGTGKVHVIHVLSALSTMEPGNLYGTITTESRIDSTKEHLKNKLTGEKYRDVQIHVTIGDAGREIANFAQKVAAELVVLSSQGQGFLEHLLVGSVAERVVKLATCPVLVLRA